MNLAISSDCFNYKKRHPDHPGQTIKNLPQVYNHKIFSLVSGKIPD